MKQRWTLQFEQLGRIRLGQMRIAPLMLLTGDNNEVLNHCRRTVCDAVFEPDPVTPSPQRRVGSPARRRRLVVEPLIKTCFNAGASY